VEKATVSPMRIFQRDVDKLALSLDWSRGQTLT
jgi:hypothetical protein